jgi:hypothetical protein
MTDGAYTGSCHCDAIGFHYVTSRDPSEWSVRVCQCRFCRMRWTTRPLTWPMSGQSAMPMRMLPAGSDGANNAGLRSVNYRSSTHARPGQ